MKNLENMKALDEIELVKVAGGDEDYTVVDAFVEWLLSPIADALNNVGGDKHVKAPLEALHKIPLIGK